MGMIIYVLLIFMFCILPLILTLVNIIYLFKKKKNKKRENIVDILIFVFGIGYTVLLYLSYGFLDYTESLRLGGLEIDIHAPIASWSMPTVITILVLGIVSYLLIRIKKAKLPPLVIVGSMSGILICSIYMIIFIIQISKNMINYTFYAMPYLVLFPINYMLCCI